MISFFLRKIKFKFLKKSREFLLNFKGNFSFLKLLLLLFLVSREKNKKNIGFLWSLASWKSVFSSLVGNRFNLNHLGNVYKIKNEDLSIGQTIEKQVIEWNKKIIHCVDKNVEGYVSSGGTESNLFLMWIGREYLKNQGDTESTLLFTDFTHYSINKAGRILNIATHIIKVDRKSWGMSIYDLEKTFLNYFKKGKFKFLLPITIGYSSTGASDPINNIIYLVSQLKKKYPRFDCFMWVDAAAQGLPKSFLENNFEPLKSNLIQGYVVDFHKYGNVPIPSGIILYRKNLLGLIEAPIPYLSENDLTITGSRPGSSALAIWANISGSSDKKWRQKFVILEKIKKELVKKIQIKNPKANILCFENSLTFAIEINSDFKALEKPFEAKYALVRCDAGGFVHYKFHIQ